MGDILSEIELRQISQLVYLDIVGIDSQGSATKLAKDYKKNKMISLGDMIDYYLGQNKYSHTFEGVNKIKERFSNELNGSNEYDQWLNMLKELDKPEYRDWTISDVVSNNNKQESGFVAITVNTDRGAVVAFRGSEPLEDPLYRNDWKNNGTTAYIDESIQQADARAYIERMIANGKFPIHLTGHSLGGNLALYSSFILPDEYRKHLVSATTFNAPGFNGSVLSQYSDQIQDMNEHGQLIEFRNVEDLVPALFQNPSKGVYIDTLAEGVGFAHHSMFSLAMEEDKGSFKRLESQQSGSLPSFIHNITVGLEIVPDTIKQLIVTEVFKIWDGRFELQHLLYAAIAALAIYSFGPIAIISMAIQAVIGLFVIGFIIDRVIPWIQQGIENVMEAIENFVEESIVFITQVVKNTITAIQLFRNLRQELATNMASAIAKFMRSVKEGVKRFAVQVIEHVKQRVNEWRKLRAAVTHNLKNIAGNIKDRMKEKIQNFKSTVSAVRSKIVEGVTAKRIKFVTSLVVGANAVRKSIKIMANLSKIEDLRQTIMRKEERAEDLVNRILSQASNAVSEAGRGYSEYYVQSKLRNVNRLCEQIRGEQRRIHASLSDKTSALQSSIVKYRTVEATIARVARTAIRTL